MLPAACNMFVVPEHHISDLGKRQAVTLSQEVSDRHNEEKKTLLAD